MRVGDVRLQGVVQRYGLGETLEHMAALLDYSERLTRQAIETIPDGVYRVVDYMDDDGQTQQPVPIAVAITVAGDQMTVDFTGTSPQRPGCINAPHAVTVSACLYVIRCVVGGQVPANQGCLRPLTIITPKGTLVKPRASKGRGGGQRGNIPANYRCAAGGAGPSIA